MYSETQSAFLGEYCSAVVGGVCKSCVFLSLERLVRLDGLNILMALLRLC